MLATLITGVGTFLMMPKRMIHFVAFAAILAAGFAWQVRRPLHGFPQSFVDKEERDASAESRTELWSEAARPC